MLGIPTHLAPRVSAWSTMRAFRTTAVAALAAAVVLLVVAAAGMHDVRLLYAAILLAVELAATVVHARVSSWVTAVAFLAICGVCTYKVAAIVQHNLNSDSCVGTYTLCLLLIPFVLAATVGGEAPSMVVWALVGFVVGRVAIRSGAPRVGGSLHVMLLGLLVIVVVLGLITVSSRSSARLRRVQPELLRSAREEHVAEYRVRVEAEATAILHDTVLNHLSAIALAPPGKVDEQLARTIERDVEMLAGREWLTRADVALPGDDAFDRMVAREREAGLDVVATGEPHAIAGLERRAGDALVRATEQCLENVRTHAGTEHAEVIVLDDGAHCTVMVVDDGKGFDEDTTGADRLGLRTSVRERISSVGGDVRIWSTPGEGTSVLLTVPYGPLTGAIPIVGGPSASQGETSS